MRVRLLIVVLSSWVALSAAMWAVAAGNFRTVERVLAPGYRAELVTALAPRSLEAERPVLRWLASELNRRFFRGWAGGQLALVVVLAVLLVGGGGGARGVPRTAKLLAGSGAAAALVLALVLTPAIRRLGPPLDFVPRPFPAEWREASRHFMRIHGAYMALDLLKVGLIAGALVVLLRRGDDPSR